MLDNIEEAAVAIACLRKGPKESAQIVSQIPSGPELKEALGVSVKLEQEMRSWIKQGIGILPLLNTSGPLTNIYQPPPVLFYRGNIECLSENFPKVAIVGSRRADTRGCALAKSFGQHLAACSNCVVSGLALGVDGAAHRGALESKGEASTIAVLGHGLMHLYPALNKDLARAILDGGGLLLSQFEPGVPPLPHHFLARNRIIAGISLAVIVIQATSKSGSLVTARFGLEEGREVLVVPGDIADPRYSGSNKLIQQGAHMLCEVSDIYDFVPQLRKSAQSSKPETEFSEIGKTIISHLKSALSVQMDDFPEELKKHPSFATELLELELSGRIERLPGNHIKLNALS